MEKVKQNVACLALYFLDKPESRIKPEQKYINCYQICFYLCINLTDKKIKIIIYMLQNKNNKANHVFDIRKSYSTSTIQRVQVTL